jgi:hypothetical protein
MGVLVFGLRPSSCNGDASENRFRYLFTSRLLNRIPLCSCGKIPAKRIVRAGSGSHCVGLDPVD